MSIVVLIPVLNRPHRVAPLLQSILESKRLIDIEPLFLVSPNDVAEQREIDAVKAPHLRVSWEPGQGDYARKINFGCQQTEAEWILAGADDLVFQHGWAEQAIAIANKTGKRYVATNDRANPQVMRGHHATHPLVHRSYVALGTVDEADKLYHEGYSHQFVDTEGTETAKARSEFVFAQMSVVEHHHPIFFRKTVPMDSTYEKGLRDGKADMALFQSRQHLWSGNGLTRRTN